ncbi:MAG TPA: OmpA family protein [Elusimicrobiota bacterium]|nr:OmpA family protein [Elusimicrobiota bacterium]
MRKPTLFVSGLAAMALLAAGCASTRAVKKSDSSAAVPSTGPAAVSPTDAAQSADMEPDVRDMATRSVPELKVVHFSYDSDLLDETAQQTLKGNADYLKSHADMKIQVAGNCDQRGTVAYNLALGQRRASAVRSYYKALGVEGSRVATISYGKEKLKCTDATDACWQRNRRAATLEVLSPNVAGQPVLH